MDRSHPGHPPCNVSEDEFWGEVVYGLKISISPQSSRCYFSICTAPRRKKKTELSPSVLKTRSHALVQTAEAGL